ncbi:MAG TPA: hypothetical protein EYG88_15185 [Desulfocapsa sulfexigens]|nr:hypothetical protein [Desulfocapsa sulfexigens]
MLDEHKEKHIALVQQVTEFQERIKNSDDGIQSEYYLFLKSWLIDHIVREDMKYSEYFAA